MTDHRAQELVCDDEDDDDDDDEDNRLDELDDAAASPSTVTGSSQKTRIEGAAIMRKTLAVVSGVLWAAAPVLRPIGQRRRMLIVMK